MFQLRRPTRRDEKEKKEKKNHEKENFGLRVQFWSAKFCSFGGGGGEGGGFMWN